MRRKAMESSKAVSTKGFDDDWHSKLVEVCGKSYAIGKMLENVSDTCSSVINADVVDAVIEFQRGG